MARKIVTEAVFEFTSQDGFSTGNCWIGGTKYTFTASTLSAHLPVNTDRRSDLSPSSRKFTKSLRVELDQGIPETGSVITVHTGGLSAQPDAADSITLTRVG